MKRLWAVLGEFWALVAILATIVAAWVLLGTLIVLAVCGAGSWIQHTV